MNRTIVNRLERNATLKQNACLVKTLEDVISRIETSEHWWMDEPGRGGFNVDYLKAVVRAAKGETE